MAFDPNSAAVTVTKGFVRQSAIEGAVIGEHVKRMSVQTQNRFADVIARGISAGEPGGTIARRIHGGVVNGVNVPGFMKLRRHQAQSLVRTAMTAVSTNSRVSVFQANADIISAIQQISTLDNRTTEICIAYSDATWDTKTLEPIGHDLPFDGGPPRHFGCRSGIIPVVASPEQLGVRSRSRIPPAVRATMDGQQSADLTFPQFLRNKGKRFQNEVLGSRKAELFRQGKLNLRELVDFSGQPLPIEVLSKRIRSISVPATYKGTGFTKAQLNKIARELYDGLDFESLGFKERRKVLRVLRRSSR